MPRTSSSTRVGNSRACSDGEPDRDRRGSRQWMAAAPGRASTTGFDCGATRCLLVGAGHGVHRGVHEPARCQHRDRRLSDPAAQLPRLARCRDLGRAVLSAGPGGPGHRGRPDGRHGGTKAPLHVWLHRLHRGLSPLWTRPQPHCPHRVPDRSGRGGSDDPGQQRGHRRPRPSQGEARTGHRDPGSGPGAGLGPRPDRRRAVDRARRMAADPLRQRADRHFGHGDGLVPDPPQPASPEAGALRLARARPLLPRRRRLSLGGVIRELDRVDLAHHSRAVRRRGRARSLHSSGANAGHPNRCST